MCFFMNSACSCKFDISWQWLTLAQQIVGATQRWRWWRQHTETTEKHNDNSGKESCTRWSRHWWNVAFLHRRFTRHQSVSVNLAATTTNIILNWHFFFNSSYSGPVPVLVMSLLFIASVFMLHIWGKYNRSQTFLSQQINTFTSTSEQTMRPQLSTSSDFIQTVA